MDSNKKPTKFVGLHSHSVAGSIGDAIGLPGEHIDFAIKNGMDALALTDHGNMNGVAHQQLKIKDLKKAGIKFKGIIGEEFYFIDSLKDWSKLYEERKAAKAEEAPKKKSAAKKQKTTEQNAIEELHETVGNQTKVDEDEATGQVIELESESKDKRKWLDPISKRNHLVLLAKNNEGVKSITKLCTSGFTKGFYKYPRIDLDLIREHAKGNIVATTACLAGTLSYRVVKNNLHILDTPFSESWFDSTTEQFKNTQKELLEICEIFAEALGGYENFYPEIQFNKIPEQHLLNWHLMHLTRNNTNFKLVATADAHYSNPEHWKEREIYKAMAWATKTKGIVDPSLLPQKISELKCELYPKNAEQMWESYKDSIKDTFLEKVFDDNLMCEAVERSYTIAHEIIQSAEFDTKVKLPKIKKLVPQEELEALIAKVGDDEDSIAQERLAKLCVESLKRRPEKVNKTYIERLKYELDVIKFHKHAKYFLTYHTIMEEAQKRLFTGSGRGSAAGSLVSYLLGLTSPDPIEHGLLFSRFLAYKKFGMPDIDCMLPETLVRLSDGTLEELGNLRAGDAVLDINNDEQLILQVKKRNTTSSDKLLTIFIKINKVYGAIVCTDKHKLFTSTKKQIEAGKLQEGDYIHSIEGDAEVVKIETLEPKDEDYPQTLVDINVSNTNSFQVIPFDVTVDDEDYSFLDNDLSITSHNSDASDRDEMIKIAIEKFGQEDVMPITTYQQLQLKSLIKDMARLNSLPFDEINKMTGAIEKETLDVDKAKPGFDRGVWFLTYESAKENSKTFNELIEKYPVINDGLKVLFKQVKSTGRHAGGSAIADNILETLPIIKVGKELQTPWTEGVNYRHLEPFGVLKFDFLGLGTLRMFEECVRKILIKQGNKNPTFREIKDWFDERLHPDKCKYDDMNVYKSVYWDNKYIGIFQFVQKNVQDFAAALKPTSINDLTAIISIFRPGPLSLGVDKMFLNNKRNPESIVYKHPLQREVLADSAGTMIYQEQLQLIYHKLAGVPLDETDGVRKAFTKKEIANKEKAFLERKTLRDEFLTKCKNANGIEEKISGEIFDEMEALVAYSFNRSCHSDTMIDTYTKEGLKISSKKICDIDAGEFLKSRDEANKQDIFVEVVKRHDHGVINVFEFEFENGKKVKCTLDHKFRVTDGRMLPIKQIIEEDLGIIFLENIAKVKSFEFIGKHQTYDLEVNHKDHQFYLSNGALTSNSHALCYAITSWQCAYFLTYYPDEWTTTYIDYCSTDKGSVVGKEDPKATAIREAKQLGYTLTKADINLSEQKTTMHPSLPKTIVPAFSSMKKVGDTAIEEILLNRPYNGIEDLLINVSGSWKHSKFNKGALETLICMEALDSMNIVKPDGDIKNYKQLHEILVGNYDLLKRTAARKKNNDIKPVIKELIEKTKDMEDWTNTEKLEMQIELMGSLDLDLVMPMEDRALLASMGFIPVNEISEGKKIKGWGIVSSAKEATTKTGKPYLKLALLGEDGSSHNCFVWGYKGEKKFLPNQIAVAVFDKTDFGLSCFSTNLKRFKTINEKETVSSSEKNEV